MPSAPASTSYQVGAISDLFTSSSLSDTPTNNLSSLFSEQNKDKFKRTIKPKEFQQKKKVDLDDKGFRKDPKKIKKPKHSKRPNDIDARIPLTTEEKER